MDEENKQAGKEDNKENVGAERQHVHIFGAEVGGGPVSEEDRAKHREEWHKHREEWKSHRAEWREARRYEHHYVSGIFWGIVMLFLGIAALLYTLGLAPHAFWHAIIPFWPLLIILWGASLILGRHWFARAVLLVLTLIFLAGVVLYGLVRTNSPVMNSLPPRVVQSIQNTQPNY